MITCERTEKITAPAGRSRTWLGKAASEFLAVVRTLLVDELIYCCEICSRSLGSLTESCGEIVEALERTGSSFCWWHLC